MLNDGYYVVLTGTEIQRSLKLLGNLNGRITFKHSPALRDIVVMYCCLLYVLSDNLVENNVSSFLASAGKDLCCFTKQVQCLCVFTDFWETPAAASCLPLSLGGPCLDWV